MVCVIRYFLTVCGFTFGIAFLHTFTSNSRNRPFVGTVSWLVVPMCSCFRVGTDRGPTVRRVFREFRKLTACGSFRPVGREVRFFTCSKCRMCSTVFPYRLWFSIRYFVF